MHDSDLEIAGFLDRVRAAAPELAVARARLIRGEGQFNHVLVVDEALVFRFPRTVDGAAVLEREVALLERLQGCLPLPIPDPVYRITDPASGELSAMGYRMLPGKPLSNEVLESIADTVTLDQMAGELAGFLRALHALPLSEFARGLPERDEAARWAELHSQFRSALYPFMRPEARRDVDVLFGEIDDDLRRDPPTPVLCHGDFAGSNILYEPERLAITGVLDFGFAGAGDPAGDIASFSCLGEAFLARGFVVYPEMAQLLPRARLYRGTFALQQALYALRDGNREDFEDGIQHYI